MSHNDSILKRVKLEARADAGKTDLAVIPVVETDSGKLTFAKSSPYADLLGQLSKEGRFKGSDSSAELVPFGGAGNATHVLFVGIGKTKSLDEEVVRKVGAKVWAKASGLKANSVSFDLGALPKSLGKGPKHDRFAGVLAEGLLLKAYRFDRHKAKKKKKESLITVTFVVKAAAVRNKVSAQLKLAVSVARSVEICRDLSNEPANFKFPRLIASEIQKIAKEFNLKCRVMTKAQILKEKMGLLWSVAQGSDEDPRVVVLEYNPPRKGKAKSIALVGKGVTFDTGGISLKPAGRMEEMKHDMTGASTVLGAICLASRMKVPHKVTCFLGFVENMPSGRATRPGDVYTGRSGKTVEVINTDAEGRLVLADVLDYAHDIAKPDVIIDAATLTGAVGVALGEFATGVMSNDVGLMNKVRAASDKTHEKLWELPAWDVYVEGMKSPYADLRNISVKPTAGTCRAGVFLKQFIRKGVKWAHFDIAYTAWSSGHLAYCPSSGASGQQVRTIAQIVNDYK